MGCSQILSLDGGGVRGVLTARILQGFEEVKDGRTTDYVDKIYASSTGSLIAGGLTAPAGFTAKKVVDLYLEWAPQIFHESYFEEIFSADGIRSTKYSDEGLVKTLEAFAGDTKFVDLTREVCFPAVDLTTKKQLWFSRDTARERGWRDLAVKDVLRATTAAPTYFSGKEITLDGVTHELLDGGISYNNPSRRVVVDACQITNGRPNLSLLSIGTGLHQSDIPRSTFQDGGAYSWIEPLLATMSALQEDNSTEEAKLIMTDPSGLFRVQPTLEKEIPLDDASKLDELVSVAADWLADNDEKFRLFCDRFKRVEPEAS